MTCWNYISDRHIRSLGLCAFFFVFSLWGRPEGYPTHNFRVLPIDQPVKWTDGTLDTCYIGAPGAGASPDMFYAKYATHRYVERTGETTISRCIDIIQPLKTEAVSFPDIVPINSQNFFMCIWEAYFRRRTWRLRGIEVIPSLSANFLITNSILCHTIDRSKLSLGQASELEYLHDLVIKQMIKQHVKKQDVDSFNMCMLGYSRGGIAVLNYLSSDDYKQLIEGNAINGKDLKMHAIVEGVFDSLKHTMTHFWGAYMPREFEGWGMPAAVQWVLLKIAQSKLYAASHNIEGEAPYAAVHKFPRDVPLLLVTSENDEFVSCRATLNLYAEFKRRKYKNVHLLILKNARHSFYATHPEDKVTYENCVHAFYKQYGLAYDEDKASWGRQKFSETQPSLEWLSEKYDWLTKGPCETCQNMFKMNGV